MGTDLTFTEMRVELKKGKKMARRGWRGKGMFIYLVKETIMPSIEFQSIDAKILKGHLDMDKIKIVERIDMMAVGSRLVCGWNPVSLDLFEDDWYEVV